MIFSDGDEDDKEEHLNKIQFITSVSKDDSKNDSKAIKKNNIIAHRYLENKIIILYLLLL